MWRKMTFLAVASALLVAGASSVYADSLWNDTSTATLFTDRRPTFVIGGLITILVDESLQASQDATTQGQKQVRNDHKWQFPRDFASGGQNLTGQLKIENQLQFNGKGATSRNGRLTFEVTGRIEDILPNGNLIVSGRKQLRVNDEVSEIMISGIVRQNDVNGQNRVISSLISDMKVDVKGTGPVSSKNTGGILTRLFNFLL